MTERRWLIQNALATTIVWGTCWFLLAFQPWLTALFPQDFYYIYIWIVMPAITALLAWFTFGGHYLARFLLYNLAIYGAWLINLSIESGLHRDPSSDAWYWVVFFSPSIFGANVAFFAVAAIAWFLQNRNSHT
jgi:hypothetical protein